MSNWFPAPNYELRQGSTLDRPLLLKFLQRTYAELGASESCSHLADTIEQYFSKGTPLWWVYCKLESERQKNDGNLEPASSRFQPNWPVACLWIGTGVDQVTGDRHTHIFLLYVDPQHRREGIGTALLAQAENWARLRGDRQITLQVFQTNQPALNLYQNLGYQTHSLWMKKPLDA
jgi:ribosomal protein S18 acetylase RimI-like enzyme